MSEEKEKDDQKKSDQGKKMPKKEEPSRDLVDRIFDEDFWVEPFGSWRLPKLLSRIDRRMFPRVDVSETGREIKVIADIPGVDPEKVDIDVESDRLIIRGTIERESESEKGTKPYRYERAYGEFRRELTLPALVKEDQVKAVCKDGVLTITLPKLHEQKKSRIKVERE